MSLINRSYMSNLINFEEFKSYRMSSIHIGALNDIVGNSAIDVDIVFDSLKIGRDSMKIKVRFLSIDENEDKYAMASMLVPNKSNDQFTIQLESYLVHHLSPIVTRICKDLNYIGENSEIVGGLWS